MSFINYNGIQLEYIQTEELIQESVPSQDGVDYLYTHFVISLNCYFNPQVTSYGVAPGPTQPPIRIPGVSPGFTDINIRHFLMQPQKVLVFNDVGFAPPIPTENLIISPLPLQDAPPGFFALVDANNGPHPISCTITRIDGIKTYHVKFVIETWLIECTRSLTDISNAGPALLSNRYVQSHDINEQHLLSKVTSGVAVFRTDILAETKLVADTARSFIFPPVSRGMKRTNIHINVVSSANTLEWSCQDDEVMYDLGETDARQGGSGIVKLDGRLTNQTMGMPHGTIPGIGTATMNNMMQVDIKAWGNKHSNNFTMFQYILLIGFQKTANLDPNKIRILQNASYIEDFTNRSVSVSLLYFVGASKGPDIAQGVATLALYPLAINALPDRNGINPSMPNGLGTRGTQSELLLSQNLKQACQFPDRPFASTCSPDSNTTEFNAGGCPAVQVTFSLILNPGYNHYSQATINAAYSHYKIDVTYPEQESRVQLPLTGVYGNLQGGTSGGTGIPPSDVGPITAEIIQLALPMSQKVVDWTAERLNAIPRIPQPAPTDGNYKLISSHITPAGFEMMADGQSVIFRVSGIYTYAAFSNQGAGDDLPIAAAPWMDFPLGLARINLEDYGDDIVA